jgi:hypothetical protein
MTTARTYPFVNASADALVQLIRERQLRLMIGDQVIAGHSDEAP